MSSCSEITKNNWKKRFSNKTFNKITFSLTKCLEKEINSSSCVQDIRSSRFWSLLRIQRKFHPPFPCLYGTFISAQYHREMKTIIFYQYKHHGYYGTIVLLEIV